MERNSSADNDGFLPVAAGVMIGMMFFSAVGEPQAAGLLDQAFRLADVAEDRQGPIKDVLLNRGADCDLLEAGLRTDCLEVRHYVSRLGLDL